VNVLIESAAFAPMSVRATARALKLHSPSSYRFERKVDQSQLDWASRRCGELILQVAGGSLLKGSVVAGRAPAVKVRPVILRHAAVRKLLGVEIPREAGHQILLRLGLIAVQQDESRTSYVVPSWRPDLQRECDLIEEIARVYGYQHLPSDSALPVIATAKTRRELVTDLLRRELTACGLCEALTLSFVSEAQLRQFCPSGLQPALGVSHSSRSHESQLRQSLIPSLLTCRRQNERNGTPNAELFEIARVYLSAGGNDPEEVSEPLTIGLVCGRGFLQVRGIVERLVSTLAPSAVLDVEPAESSEFAAGRGAKVLLNGQPLGWLGELHARLRSELDLHDDVTVVELRLPLLEQLFEPTRRYVPLPRFPAVTRDLNFVLPESVSWKQLESVVRTAGGGLLSGVAFGGQYRGRQIDAGHKSYVVGCRFQAADRTLTAEEVDAAISSVIDQCTRELAARLRG
jgi:phenylalanyl-tRNA synthetase beta chain